MAEAAQALIYDALTEREQDVLQHIAEGMSNREIAETLVLAVETVKWYAKQIYSKLDVSSRTQAVARARDLGLLGGQVADEVGAPRLPVRVHNLPLQLSSFVGRQRETEDVVNLLATHRLVTLVGPGGAGKSRLALRAAEEYLDTFRYGVWHVELAPLTDEALVASAIADVLNIREQAGQPLEDVLCTELARRELLLVLDNFEHLMGAVGVIVSLLAAAPELKVLVTSREVLNVTGERVYNLSPLVLPGRAALRSLDELRQVEAVRLFLDRARAVRRDFELTEANAPVIAQICTRLDGLPLAIELAAARMRIFAPEALLAQLDDRFGALRGGPRDAPARQRTLRAALDWSYDLLTEDEQRFLARLSVFEGGRTIEAAREVCSHDLDIAVLDALESLYDKSLLQQIEGRDGEPRFVMLETIHHYARERLAEWGESEPQQARVAEYFATLVRSARREVIAGPRQLYWLKRLEAEHDNLRATLRWGIEGGDVDMALDMVGDLHVFWLRHGYHGEWGRWARRALAHAADAPPGIRAKVLLSNAAVSWLLRDMESAAAYAEEAQAIFHVLGDDFYETYTSVWHSKARVYVGGSYDVSIAALEAAAMRFAEMDAPEMVAFTQNIIGETARTRGDFRFAQEMYECVIETAKAIGDVFREHINYLNLGHVALRAGDYRLAVSVVATTIRFGMEQASPSWCMCGFSQMGAAAAGLGDPEKGAMLLGAGAALGEQHGVRLQPADRVAVDGYVAMIRKVLGDEVFTTHWNEGCQMTAEEAFEAALSVG